MDRDRGDRRYPERDYYGNNSDTYRPGAPSGPAGESYRPGDERARVRSRTPPRNDTYRRRSRSPPREDRYRDARDGYRERSRERRRSPPRRPAYSPRREENNYRPARSPVRDTRYAPRSPRRDRSPMSVKRSRDPSPVDRRPRSPPPKRERLASPVRGRYRSPSPPRRPAYSPPHERPVENNYRPRARSPRQDVHMADRYAHRSPSPRRPSGADSGATSRRSSPHVHPSRLRQIPDTQSPRPNPVSTYDNRSPYASPPPRERAFPATNGAPPTGPRAGTRAPPTGPANARNFSTPAMAPPTGPAAGHSPVAAHRPAPAAFSAPSRPRGGGFSGGGAPRGGFGGAARGNTDNGASSHYSREFPHRENPSRDFATPRRASEAYPTGPRNTFAGGAPPTGPSGRGGAPPTGPAAFRQPPTGPGGNASSTTYPRSQRFLADLPTVVPGGRKMPVKLAPNNEKVRKLEVEAERLRKAIEQQEIDKRAKLREWERLEGEAGAAKLGSELAGERLRVLEMEEMTMD